MSEYRVTEHTRDHSPFVFQPLCGARLRELIKLIQKNGFEKSALAKIAYVTTMSALVSPFKAYEKLRYDKTLENHTLKKDPVFILGHWRSGTTHLHNLLARDPNTAYLTTFQAWGPDLFLGSEKLLKPFLHLLIPSERPMDKVALSVDEPQEEEFALANMGAHSFYNGMFFNNSIDEYFDRYTSFRLADKETYEGWKKDYSWLLKKMSFGSKGKRVISKNPANTARIEALLELYPNAKFVHISRNPYKVYASTVNLYNSLGFAFGLGKPWQKNIEDIVLRHYRTVMMSYLSKKHLIPKENLIDIRYEAFIDNEIDMLEMIYDKFGIEHFAEAKPHFQSYLDSIGSFEKNSFELDAEAIQSVSKNWEFAFDRLRYPQQSTYTRHSQDAEEARKQAHIIRSKRALNEESQV